MSGPPEDIAPNELWLKLQQWPRPSEVVDFPRFDAQGKSIGKIRIRVLTIEEHDKARIAAHERMKARKLSAEDLQGMTIREVYGDAVAKELLAVACLTAEAPKNCDPDKPIYGRVFRNADDLDKLAPDELAVLFNAYLLVQSKYGPFERNLSAEDLEAWIKRLTVGGSNYFLAQLPSPAAAKLTSSLATMAHTLFLALESHWENLPDTLRSKIEMCVPGIGSYGSLPDEPTDTYSVNLPSEPITMEQATDLARRFRDA